MKGGVRARIASLAVATAAITLLLTFSVRAQQTTCFASLQGDDKPLAQELGADPVVVISRVQGLLAPGAPPAGVSRARLYAILADAFGVKGDSSAARDAAVSGIAALTAHDDDALRRRLDLSSIYYLGETGQLVEASRAYEAAAARVPADAADLACVLEIRGYLRIRTQRLVEAANDLAHAAQLAKDRGSERYSLDAESVLSLLYAKSGLYEEAHSLVAKAIAAALRADDKIDLANAYFRRGDVYLLQGDLSAAESDFQRSAKLSRSMDQPSLAAQADERLCTTLAQTQRYDDARRMCLGAVREATVANDPESIQLAYAGLGQIEFADSHFRVAVDYLNRALSTNGADMPPSQIARFRKLRGRVRDSLGDTAGALADVNAYLAWADSDGNTRKVAQMAMARAKFDAAISEQKLARTRAEADAANLTAARARLEINVVLLATALVLSTGFSAWWLWRRRREVERVTQAADERFATIGRLTAGIAHEFNNQLTVVQHGLSLLARRPAVMTDPTSQSLLRDLQESTHTSATITAQLQSFGRQQQLNPHRIAMSSFFQRIEPQLAKLAGERVQVRLENASPDSQVYADERPLTEALLNLVSNARDSLPGGGIVTIQVEPGASGFTTIRVIDDGVGMSADVLAHAPEPFFTTKPVGSGTGLGLSMVEGFVTQTGGSMSISSTPQRGTVVTLQLPTDSRPL